MGARPSLKYSLDRFPNKDGNYEQSNCRWATIFDQQRNKSNNVYIHFDDKVMVMQDLAKEIGLHPTTVLYHLKNKGEIKMIAFFKSKGYI